MQRGLQTLLFLSLTAVSWLLMMVLHEGGHVAHGWLTGAQVACVDLPPWGFSRTDFSVNPHPLFVAWGGAVTGCLLAIVAMTLARFVVPSHAYLARWFAGFSLIANGAYILAGPFVGGDAVDARVILEHGGALWQVLLFGVLAIGSGLYLWNGLGPRFGLGPNRGKISAKTAIGMAIALLIVVGAEIVIQSIRRL